MATARRRSDSDLISLLKDEPFRFRFFQAVRLVERELTQLQEEKTSKLNPVGYDNPPESEVVRFRAPPTLRFPPNEIDGAKPRQVSEKLESLELTIAFMGLFGPSGALPRHYTQLVIDQVRRRDSALRDYLDMFNHRAVSLFYRAWKKYRFQLDYERLETRAKPDQADLFTRSLYALVGRHSSIFRNRVDFFDETWIHFGGNFSRRPRSADALQAMLRDFFKLPIRVCQFQGRWLRLRQADQSAFPSAEHPQGLNMRLGTNTIVGSQIWSVEHNFRLRVGPLDRTAFRNLLPGHKQLTELAQFTQAYVGHSLEFDVQLILKKEDVTGIQLDSSASQPDRLGQTTWLCSHPPDHDVDDAVFSVEGLAGPSTSVST